MYEQNFCPRLLYSWIKSQWKEMNPACWAQDQHNTSETTTLHVMARKINIWTCWATRKLNPGPFARAANGLTTEPTRPHHSDGVERCYSIVDYEVHPSIRHKMSARRNVWIIKRQFVHSYAWRQSNFAYRLPAELSTTLMFNFKIKLWEFHGSHV